MLEDNVEVSRADLESLLKEAGREESALDFTKKEGSPGEKARTARYKKRAKTAWWSCVWLGFTAAVSVGSWIFCRSFEDLISAIAFGVMTYIEIQVYHFFKQGDERAVKLGWRNQCAFSASFLIYGAYHYYTVVPIQEVGVIGGPEMMAMATNYEKMFYLAIGIGGAIGQLLVGWHYLRANHEK